SPLQGDGLDRRFPLLQGEGRGGDGVAPASTATEAVLPHAKPDMMQADDNALEALFVPFEEGALRWPADDRVLFLNARDGFALRENLRDGWVCQQHFKPFAEVLARAGADVREPAGDERFALVCLLPMRQRDAMRAQYARALD